MTPGPSPATLLAAATMLAGGGAMAQSSACEQFEQTLGARIEAGGVRDYSLETVPAETPLPPGARVIGTCEGGRYKVLYRRGGAKQPAAGAGAAPAVQEPKDAKPRRATSPADRIAPPAAPASAPSAAPPPLVARATEAASAPEPAADSPAPAPPASDAAVAARPSRPLSDVMADFMTDKWHWLWALALLPLAAWLWAWLAHRSAYDEDGLPRGPKL